MSKDIQKILVGVAFVGIGLSLLFIKDPNVSAKVDTFEDEPVSIVGLSGLEVEKKKLPNRILIPSLSVDLPVRKAEIMNGYWEVFDDSAGWGTGSGIPGKKGNTVIFAHAKANLFAPIKNIEKGNQIIVFTDEHMYRYAVESLEEVSPNNTTVIDSTDAEVLTLYTCSGYKDSKRFIVKAKRN